MPWLGRIPSCCRPVSTPSPSREPGRRRRQRRPRHRRDLTITGDGRDVTIIDAAGLDRVFHVLGDGDPYPSGTVPQYVVQLRNLTIRGGQTASNDRNGAGVFNNGARLTLASVAVSHNLANASSSVRGGGIGNHGVLTVTDSLISDNGFQGGGFAMGGGVYNFARMVISNSQIVRNSANNFGGGVSTGNVHLSAILSTTVSGNSAGETGGGLHIGTSGAVQLTGSQFLDNSACRGGGIWAMGATIADFTVRENRVASGCTSPTSSGVFLLGATTIRRATIADNIGGPGLFHQRNTATDILLLTESTVSGNPVGLYLQTDSELVNVTISGNGTGIEDDILASQTTLLTQVTLTGNSLAIARRNDAITLRASLLVDNGTNCNLAMISGNYNLEDANSCGLNGANDQVNTTVALLPLADNGGGTLTHALPPGSAPVDVVPANACPAQDQRGFLRPIGSGGNGLTPCDVGAYELGAFLPTSFLNLPAITVR